MTDGGSVATADGGERSSLLHKIMWTAGAFGASFLLKIASTVLLARLLAPEIFGVMVVVQSIRIGMELLTDVGIEQNIVNHHHGLTPRFFNTAWTIQIVRGLLLSLLFAALSPWLSAVYRLDPTIFLAVSCAPLLNSLASTSIFVLVKTLEVRRRNLFELQAEVINFLLCVGLALLMPTVWALIWGMLLSIAARSALSYRLPHPAHRLLLDRRHVREILGFGKWIMASSLLNYASTYIDRLFIGRMAPMQALGLYGIARNISDLPGSLAGRLGYRVFFPLIARLKASRDEAALREFARVRLLIVVVAACGVGMVAAGADIAVDILYDDRYRAAGPILFLLLLSAWFTVLAQLNEVALLGLGRASAVSYANGVRIALLCLFMPPGFHYHGLAGATAALVASEAGRFLHMSVASLRQRALGIAFGRQDAGGTLLFLIVVGVLTAARHRLGLGVPWAGL